jgi:prolyl oligopeptidase
VSAHIATKKTLPDRLRWIKFASVAWKDHGFYYSRYDAPADTTRQLSSINDNQKVYYHRVGTPQSDDVLVHADAAHPRQMFGVGLTDDEQVEILWKSEPGHNGNAFSIRDHARGELDFRPIVETFDDRCTPIEQVGGKLLVETNRGAPNGRVVLVDPDKPAPEHWVDVIPEKGYPISFTTAAGGKLIVGYRKDVTTRVSVHTLTGAFEREVQLPALGSAGGFGGWREDTTVFYSFSSFTHPPAIYEYDLRTGESRLFKKADVPFNPDDYQTDQVFFTSKDGTRVPMFLVYRKGLTRNGNNPTLMYGYGGFNIPIPPGFDALRIALLEQGFIYASVNLRGGSEYGEKWHEGGMVLNKQNVFDDFIAGAEWLIKEGYTSSARLAMAGGSNGGLLVGVVMTQRPELFKVALPAVGVMDMLRFQKFTIGYTWVTDYGSSDDSTQFAYIYRYSPLHNLKPGVAYPATLATTADHDDRVVPAHSFKFIATLQEKQAGPNPTLIRIETRSGHSASNTSVRIDLTADTHAFLMQNLGVVPK